MATLTGCGLVAGLSGPARAQTSPPDYQDIYEVDPTFLPRFDRTGGEVYAIIPDESGGFYLSGFFSSVDGMEGGATLHFDESGNRDRDFSSPQLDNSVILALALDPAGRLIAGGGFKEVDGESYSSLVRLHSDGSVDRNLNTGRGFRKTFGGSSPGLVNA